MIDSLSKILIVNGLSPESFIASESGGGIFRDELPAGRVVETWIKLAKAASDTKYWPIIRGALDGDHESVECDAEAVLAAAPAGSIREILKPRFEERPRPIRKNVKEHFGRARRKRPKHRDYII